MRSLSSALNAAYGYPVKRPAWLVRIDLSSSIYLASYKAVTWDSINWTKTDINVANLRVGALSISGSLVFGNADDSAAAMVLNETFTDKRIRIWGYDANIAAPTVADVPLLCDGVGAGADINPDRVQVGIRDACEYRLGPRAVVSSAWGFNVLMAAGTVVTINGITFTINRGR